MLREHLRVPCKHGRQDRPFPAGTVDNKLPPIRCPRFMPGCVGWRVPTRHELIDAIADEEHDNYYIVMKDPTVCSNPDCVDGNLMEMVAIGVPAPYAPCPNCALGSDA